MKSPKFLLCLGCALQAGLASAQVPPLLNFQGRVVVGNVNFDGTGQFKFALVNSNGTATFWSNDGTSSAGGQPANAVSLAVSKGLYSVLLGNTSLPNMGPLPANVFTNAHLRLRVWFSDGINGFQLFTPDQRIAAVAYAIMSGNVPDGSISSAKLADGAVTLAKVDNDVKAGLGGTPSGGVMLTENPNASNLLASGFVKLPGVKVVTEEWDSVPADTNVPFGSMSPSPIWTGSDAYFFREAPMFGPLASRYNPAQNTWHALPTNGMPTFMDFKAVWIGNELLVLGGTPEGLSAARYRPTSDSWQPVNTNGAPYYSSWESTVVWTGSELLVLSGSPAGLTGGRYRPLTDNWLPISTNGAPMFHSMSSTTVWTGTELILLTLTPEFTGARYRPATDTWLAISTNGAPGIGSAEIKVVWTGTGLVVLSSSPEVVRGARYDPSSDTWLAATTNGAPNFSLMEAKGLWTGAEVIVWDSSPPTPGQQTGARYNPATDMWRSLNADVPRFGMFGPPNPDPIWTGSEMVIGFSFDETMYAYAGGRYNPATDSWMGISMPPDRPGSSSFSRFVWTGEQALMLLQDAGLLRWRMYEWTPSRTLHLYLKP